MDYRISRLLGSLRATERAALVLQAYKAGTPEDPGWRKTMPQSQQRDFNRAIGAINAANVQLTSLIAILGQEVEQLQLRFSLLTCMVFLHGVPAHEGEERPPFDPLQATAEAGERGDTADAIAERIVENLAESTRICWSELRQVELVLEEMEPLLPGHDLLRPQTRARLDSTKADIQEFAGELRELGLLVALEDPTDADMASIRRLVDHARRL